MGKISNSKRFGLKTFAVYFLSYIVAAFSLLTFGGTTKLGTATAVLVIAMVCTLKMFSIININSTSITVKPVVSFLGNLHIIPIEEIEKIEIIPSYFLGSTSYIFYLNDNTKINTDAKLLKVERETLVKKLKTLGIEVVIQSGLYI